MMALLGDVVVAEAAEGDLVKIEGNWYFPPQSITASMFEKSDRPSTVHGRAIVSTSMFGTATPYVQTRHGPTRIRSNASTVIVSA